METAEPEQIDDHNASGELQAIGQAEAMNDAGANTEELNDSLIYVGTFRAGLFTKCYILSSDRFRLI